jgi:hypothetical protein
MNLAIHWRIQATKLANIAADGDPSDEHYDTMEILTNEATNITVKLDLIAEESAYVVRHIYSPQQDGLICPSSQLAHLTVLPRANDRYSTGWQL